MGQKELETIFENLFNPISNKDYGKYWFVSNKKRKPLKNAEELLEYVKQESKEGCFINRYSNLQEDLILENNIYLDFDLTNKSYLKQEKGLTTNVLKELASKDVDSTVENPVEKNNNQIIQQIQQKYNNEYSEDNNFINGLNSFIDNLTTAEIGVLTRYVKAKESEEVKRLKSANEVKQYYIHKFTKGYLEEPFKEATKTAKYFDSIGVKTVLNWSGSKGLHLRIPISKINLEYGSLKDNPENIKLFLIALAELIETKILDKSRKNSSLDYNVFCKGMQRVPTSKHNKTLLYANFIEPSFDYLEAVDYLETEEPVYIPELIDVEENTEKLMSSKIVAEAIEKAETETNNTTNNSLNIIEGNINYNFTSTNKKLKEIIAKVYLPSCRNEVGFRIVHLLKRSNFSKQEIEDIFKELHQNSKDYKETIQGSIDHAFKTEKLVGLNNLVKWIYENASSEVKEEVVKYFLKEFSYSEEVEETTIKEPLHIDETDYKLIFRKTKKEELLIIKNFIAEGYTLEIKPSKEINFKKEGIIIAKLKLKNKDDAEEYVEPSSQKKAKLFEKTIKEKVNFSFNMEELFYKINNILISVLKEYEEEKLLNETYEQLNKTGETSVIDFGRTKDYEYYKQNNLTKKIYFVKEGKKNSQLTTIAKATIKNIEMVLDPLKLFEPVYNVKYYNGVTEKTYTLKNLTKEQVIEEFRKSSCFYKDVDIDTVLSSFILDAKEYNKVSVKEEVFLEGFFLVNGKVIGNTNLPTKTPTKEQLAEAINLLNEIMKSRSKEGKRNDSAVYRFMLWNPFSYCLKELGFNKANYSLILQGTSGANKTGATTIGYLFYRRKEQETSGSTVSVFGSKLGENTFASVFDESEHLFILDEAETVMKKAIYEKTVRSTKDRNDNKKIDVFHALNLPMFLLNEPQKPYKDYITNRYKVIRYTNESFISSTAKKEFNKKYVPEAEDTILNKLAIIGKAFSERIIKLIEAKDKRLFNIEETTIEILKEISAEAEVEFLPEMYETTIASDRYNYDVQAEIKNLLNREFKNKVRRNKYNSSDFVESARNNDFDFLIYDNKKMIFFIVARKLTDYINMKLKENLEIETILEVLGLKEELIAEASEDNKEFKDYIKKSNKINGETKRGFKISIDNVIKKLFNFNLDFEEIAEDKSLNY